MTRGLFSRRCFLAGAALGTAVKAGDPQPIGELVGGMAELVKLQRLPRLASDVDPSEFPQTDDVWQADFFHSPTFISNDDVGVERPWAAIVMDKRSSFMLSNELLRGEPTPEALWDHVVRSMAHPGPRDPMRPSTVEVADSTGMLVRAKYQVRDTNGDGSADRIFSTGRFNNSVRSVVLRLKSASPLVREYYEETFENHLAQ